MAEAELKTKVNEASVGEVLGEPSPGPAKGRACFGVPI